jgi:hypothetical protein
LDRKLDTNIDVLKHGFLKLMPPPALLTNPEVKLHILTINQWVSNWNMDRHENIDKLLTQKMKLTSAYYRAMNQVSILKRHLQNPD